MNNFDEILIMTDDLTDRELNMLIQELSRRYRERIRRQAQLEALREIRNTVLNL